MKVLTNRLIRSIDTKEAKDLHPGLMSCAIHFKKDKYPVASDVELLSLEVMMLLIEYAYPAINGYSKFTIAPTIRTSSGDISFTAGPAISLTCSDGNLLPESEVYAHILRAFAKIAEIYDATEITSISIRIYTEKKKDEKDRTHVSIEDISIKLSSLMQADKIEIIEPRTARKIKNKMRSYPPGHITAVKQSSTDTEMQPFLVADTETILIDDVHKPYAAGLLKVMPGEDLSSKDKCIETYFSEDYTIILSSFEERSTKVLFDLIERISTIVKKDKSIRTIYFHNFSRFDGIILLKHLACHHKQYRVKPMMRNNKLYELVVFHGKIKLFRFRDSLNILPSNLDNLAKNLCPELGSKGSIPYEDVKLSNLVSMKTRLLDYMKQDILLLGGVMRKAQDLYWNAYKVDIESKITLPSLALTIFRKIYYDPKTFPIHIPNLLEDTFIRRGYYGGHADTYIPYGENLYYYDVNSLYPFIMKTFPMPGGKPKWCGNLEGQDLDGLFGFIEAYVLCPKTIKRPFLPYRDDKNTLLFPTGEFIGVYYSEELKYARSLGYTVIPLSGYLFEKMETPFESFVSSLFESRLKAKESGNDALSYVYKNLMNSLYGRFGINPVTTVTEVCSQDRYNFLIRNSDLIFADQLNEKYYIVSYWSGKGSDYWNPPKISAVQLAAAITACARIYMYPYISREDCYYTDTDSVVLGQPLPEEEIHSSVLGKFKLEHKVKKAIFLAPKSYSLLAEDGVVLKHKGPAKAFISEEWFESQYEDISRTEQVSVEAPFRIDFKKLNITKKEIQVNLGIKVGTKRIPVYSGEDWVDTKPMEITDLSGLNTLGIIMIKSLRAKIMKLLDDNARIHSILAEKEREIEEKNQDG